MDSVLWVLVIFAGVGVGLWLVSFVMASLPATSESGQKLIHLGATCSLI